MLTMETESREDIVSALEALDTRLRWLSSWTVHNANHIRPKRDGLKVGGHQASCASMTAIMSALYFHALRPQDKVAVKPHAGPVLQAIHYLLGNQALEQLQRFRVGCRRVVHDFGRHRVGATMRRIARITIAQSVAGHRQCPRGSGNGECGEPEFPVR